jgi:hypothetical protein
MRRSAWIVGVPVVTLVAGVFLGPAQAGPPTRRCSGPSDLGGGMLGTLCMGTVIQSGTRYATDQPYSPPTHVQFTSMRAHYWDCAVHLVVQNPSSGETADYSFGCTQVANRHGDFVPADNLGVVACQAGDVVYGWMYVLYKLQGSPRVMHRSKNLPDSVTCSA